ncbi:MAG: hypothetical protein AAGF13_01635 [Pseudomonadota bacterium]
MATRADGHTQVVNTLKVLLPLGALALLSTLFFFAGEVDPTDSIPYAELKVDEIVKEPRMSAPYFAGVTNNGLAITITGAAVRPDPEDRERFRIEGLKARFEDEDKRMMEASAPVAEIDSEAGTAMFSGGTVINTSDGLRLETEGVLAGLETASLKSLGHISAKGPFGSIIADGLAIERPAPNLPHRIVFQGNVKLVYNSNNK